MGKIFLIPRLIALKAIRIYQIIFSFDHGLFSHNHPHGFCRFYPSCSEYSYRAIEKFGLIKGGFKGIKRILRCHPFSRGGYDSV